MSEDAAPAVGSYAVDSRDGSLGQVMGYDGGCAQLRPVGGGREWDCPAGAVRTAELAEVLRARVREINREGRLP